MYGRIYRSIDRSIISVGIDCCGYTSVVLVRSSQVNNSTHWGTLIIVELVNRYMVTVDGRKSRKPAARHNFGAIFNPWVIRSLESLSRLEKDLSCIDTYVYRFRHAF
jgi:hypothetical protein